MRNLYALLVAVNEYHDARYDLEGCVNDLLEMKLFLEQFYNNQEIQLHTKAITNREATRENVIQGFAHFDHADDHDLCLFFYSGHGSRIPAPEPFWHLESDKMLQSIVCHDSRTPNGRDLLDKEISYLIWKALQGKKEVHFTTIMDCCYSGDNTRFHDLDQEESSYKVKMISPKLIQEEMNQFLGHEHFYQDKDGFVKAPVGRHIALSASKSSETAKEVYARYAPRGAFAYALNKTLISEGRNIPYTELIKRTGIRVKQYVKKQSPQLQFTDNKDASKIFLDGVSKHLKKYYLINFDRHIGWKANGGRLNGFQEGDKNSKTKLLLTEDDRLINVEKVFPTHSLVEGTEGLDKKTVYEATIDQMSVEKLKLHISQNVDPKIKERFLHQLQKLPSDFLEIVTNKRLAKYQIQQSGDHLGVSYLYDQRHLAVSNQGHHQQGINDLINRLEYIAKWEQALNLANPNSSFSILNNAVEVFQITEAGNFAENTPHQKVDPNLPIQLPYLFDGDKWCQPGFRVKIKNTSGQSLWFSALYLGDRYDIDPILPAKELANGEEAWFQIQVDDYFFTTLGVQLEDFYLEKGLTQITEYIKVIVSTDEFNTIEFQQEGLPWDEFLSSVRSHDRRIHIRHKDWATTTLKLIIQRPFPLISLSGTAQMHFGIRLNTLPSLQGAYSFHSFEDAFAKMDPRYRIEGQPGLCFNPFELTPSLKDSPGLSVISFYDFIEPENLSIENGFTIQFTKPLSQKPIPYQYLPTDGNFVQLPHTWKNDELRIHHLPTASFTSFFEELGAGKHIFFQ